ncbi:EpsG family protein [Soonwooa sp.]|uniref:EpsG family protein n=1 Tax=Soonwooa sp. TaxID=1938592 RepID=UPI002602CA7F|nr:EpsG family protein [Soonwooa sp.]
MQLLHPYFLVAIILMIIFSFHEVYQGKVNRRYLYILGAYFIVLAGFRNNVGADYGSYWSIYTYSQTKDYWSIFLKALTMKPPTPIELEWGYVLINKIVGEFHAPFHILTFVIAALAVTFKNKFVEENSVYPFTVLLLIFIPGFFIGESGQVRQNLGSFIAYFGIRYIKERRVWMYLLFVYLAGSIHNVCYILYPMYWLARIPLTKSRMILLIIASILASPFEVYRVFGSFLDSIASDSAVIGGFNGYMNESTERLQGGFGIPEAMMIITTFFLFVFDTPMRKKYPYYEYHRNYVVLGICCFFIFRNNAIFSSRLAGVFLGFSPLLIVNSMYVVNEGTKRLIHFFILFLVAFNLVIFSSFVNITKGRFSIDLYRNWVLP